MQERREDEDDEDEILIITPRDHAVVHPPTELQGQPWQSRFIFNPNQPWPPVLATRFFPPPPWPENLEGENLTIEPVVGPFLALTEEQMETPPGFGRFVEGSFEPGVSPLRMERALERRAVRRDLREDRREAREEIREEAREERREERREEEREEREPRRRGRRRRDLDSDRSERPTGDWPSGGGG